MNNIEKLNGMLNKLIEENVEIMEEMEQEGKNTDFFEGKLFAYIMVRDMVQFLDEDDFENLL